MIEFLELLLFACLLFAAILCMACGHDFTFSSRKTTKLVMVTLPVLLIIAYEAVAAYLPVHLPPFLYAGIVAYVWATGAIVGWANRRAPS